MTIVNVNGHQVETGCWVEGHWGQYGPDRLAEQVESLGWRPDATNDPRAWRVAAEEADEKGLREHSLWEYHIEAMNDIESWLNEHTPDGFVWYWHDGEFFLAPICDDPDECTDDTCAHWD